MASSNTVRKSTRKSAAQKASEHVEAVARTLDTQEKLVDYLAEGASPAGKEAIAQAVAVAATIPATIVAATPVAAPVAPATQPQGTPRYVLSATAAKLATEPARKTLQYKSKDHGKGIQWRDDRYEAPNMRVGALAAVLAGCGEQPFTFEQALSWLGAAQKNGLPLGHGTPRSYAKAFVKNGYFTAVSE